METPPRWRVPTQAASLFGKLPTVLDYVRVNHSYPAAIALDEWLSRALQELTVASLSWSKARYRFLFAPAGAEHALVGVVAASRDRAGRKFPLSVFAPLPIAAVVRDFAALPLSCGALFDAAEKLLEDASTLTRDAAEARLAELPLPGPEDLDEGRKALHHALAARASAEFAAEQFPDGPYQAEDAYARFVATVSKVRSAAPERVSVLDCPVSSGKDVGAWLTLCQRLLAWTREVPSLFWSTEPEPGRLLISLGTPPPTLTLWLADRKRKSDRLVALGGGRVSSASQPSAGELTDLPSREQPPASTAPALLSAPAEPQASTLGSPAEPPASTLGSLPEPGASTTVEAALSEPGSDVADLASEAAPDVAPQVALDVPPEAAPEPPIFARAPEGALRPPAPEPELAAPVVHSLLQKLSELSAP